MSIALIYNVNPQYQNNIIDEYKWNLNIAIEKRKTNII